MPPDTSAVSKGEIGGWVLAAVTSSLTWGENRSSSTLVGLVAAVAIAGLGIPATAAPPELGWEIFPGAAVNGSADSQTATQGPIQVFVTNGPPGVTSNGSTTVNYGTLAVQTGTTVDAAQQTGESFCLPPHCSDAEGWWADRLVFTAPGVVANGTDGSFTAQLTISGQLDSTISSSWSFVTVASEYVAIVELDGVLLEQIGANCIAIPGMSCFPVTLQIYYPGPVTTTPPSPFGTFTLGPYDFTYGQPFDIEVRLRTDALLDATLQTTGVSSASADLGSTLVWAAVLEMFDGPGGTGTSIPLGSALVFPASGADWLQTVAVPEPDRRLLLAGAFLTLAGLRIVPRRFATGRVRSP